MEFKLANEALEEAWYDSFRNLATAAKTAAGDVKKSATGRVQAAAQTNLQKDISKNLFNMIISAQKLQNSINSTQEFPNKEVLMQNLTNIESELQKNYTMLTGRDYTSKTAQTTQPEVAQQVQQPEAQPELASTGQQTTQNVQATQTNQQPLNPMTNQVFDNLKRDISITFRENPSTAFKGTDEATVLALYKNYINDALNTKTLAPLNKLTKNNNLRFAAKDLVSQVIGKKNIQKELEESSSKPTFKIKIGESC